MNNSMFSYLQGSFLKSALMFSISFLTGYFSEANGAVIFQDADFIASDWTSTKYVDATIGQSASFVTSTITSGGLPGSYRQVLMTFREGGGMRVAHLRSGSNGFKWNPSAQGAFSSIDYSFNLIMTQYFDPAPVPAPGPAAVGYRLLLYQDGFYYTAPIVVVSTNDNRQWISVSNSNLQASQFQRIDPSNGAAASGLNPDFSASGSEIIFGYETVNSHGSTGVFKATESGIDNYKIRLNDTFPSSEVPEPSTSVLALGLLTLSGLRSFSWRVRAQAA
jgi:hypothetical protein